MIQKNYIYPKFEAGQVLSSNLLNKTVGFLEEQDRLTRANIIGTGIIDGLSYTYKNGKLTIFPGTAITADGFLIHYPKEKTYTICSKDVNLIKDNIPLDDKNDIEASPSLLFLKKHASYILFENNDDAFGYNATDSGFPNKLEDDYVVTLVVDFPETALITCKEVSCDRYVKQTRIEIHPVLILKKISSSIVFPKPYRKITPINHIAELKSFRDFSSLVNTNVIASKTAELFKNNCNTIKTALDKILNQFVDSTGYLDCKSIISEYRDKIKKLEDCRGKFQTWNTKSTYNELPQYFLLFLEDVCCAINEFISYYNAFADKYPYIRTSHAYIDRIVAINPTRFKENDEYFYRFCPVQADKTFEIECKTLEKLLCRIYELSVSFLGFKYSILKKNPKTKDKFKISFDIKNLNCPMGENPIPYYFDKDKLQPYWDAFSLFDKKESQKNKEVKPEQEESNIILFQNCYGENVDTVHSILNNFLKKQNISSIQVNTVSIGKRKLKNQYVNALKHIYGRYDKIKKKFIEKKLNDYDNIPFINSIDIVRENGIRENIKLSLIKQRLKKRFIYLRTAPKKSFENTIIKKRGTRIYIGKCRVNALRIQNLQYKRLTDEKNIEIANARTILKVARALYFDTNDNQATNNINKVKRELILSIIGKASRAESIKKSEKDFILNSIKDIKIDDFILFYEFIQDCINHKEYIRPIRNQRPGDSSHRKGRVSKSPSTMGMRSYGTLNSFTYRPITPEKSYEKVEILLDSNLWKLDHKKIFHTCYFASFFALKSYVELGYNSEYDDAIYCGGIKTNTNVYLFYHQSGITEKENNKLKLIGHKKRFFIEIFKKR